MLKECEEFETDPAHFERKHRCDKHHTIPEISAMLRFTSRVPRRCTFPVSTEQDEYHKDTSPALPNESIDTSGYNPHNLCKKQVPARVESVRARPKPLGNQSPRARRASTADAEHAHQLSRQKNAD